MLPPSEMPPRPEYAAHKRFSGSRVLVAIAIGTVVGVALSYFLKVLIENTPADLDIRRMRLFFLMVITSCSLAGKDKVTTQTASKSKSMHFNVKHLSPVNF